MVALGGVRASRAHAGPLALLLHQLPEALVVDRQPLLLEQLSREVVGEAERVVELEGVLGVDPRRALRLRALDQLREQPGALLERAAEALLLRGEPLLDRVALALAAPGRRRP